METIIFDLKGDFIELTQLLKAVGVAQTGGHAKMIVNDGVIQRNGEVELRKRAKIRTNEELIIDGQICVKVVGVSK